MEHTLINNHNIGEYYYVEIFRSPKQNRQNIKSLRRHVSLFYHRIWPQGRPAYV